MLSPEDQKQFNQAITAVLKEKMPEYTEMLDAGGKWAETQPEEVWALGPPPKVFSKDMLVAVKTATGAILTGSLYTFAIERNRVGIPKMEKYGPMVAWLPFGEPNMSALAAKG